MSVLSDSVKPLSVEEPSAEWERLRAALLQEREGLLSLLFEADAQIPLPKGFFVGEDERKATYRAVCRLLGVLEVRVRKIRTLSLTLSQILASLAKQQKDTVRAEMLLWEVGQAAKSMTDDPTRQAVDAMRQDLTHTKRKASELLAALKGTEQSLRTLCSTTLSDFCTRMYAFADMEHDGAACNPASVARLCGELRAVLEALTL